MDCHTTKLTNSLRHLLITLGHPLTRNRAILHHVLGVQRAFTRRRPPFAFRHIVLFLGQCGDGEQQWEGRHAVSGAG